MAGIVLLGLETAISNRMKGPVEGTRITPTAQCLTTVTSISFPSNFSQTLGRQRAPGIAAISRGHRRARSAGIRRARRKSSPIVGCRSSIAPASRARRSSPAFPVTRRRSRGRSRGIPRASSASSCSIRRLPTRRRGPSTRCDRLGLRAICLFPAMQRYSLHDTRVKEIVQLAAAHAGTAVFVHCGALSVGVRKKLGLPSRFDVRHGNPLDLHALAADHPGVPFIIPHFGAGLFREALARRRPRAERVPRHVEHEPVDGVSPRARRCRPSSGRRSRWPVPDRLLFGTDSSFFPARVEPGGLRRAGKRARRRGRRRGRPPSNFHR